MRIACWIPKATNTHSEYVILIAFPLQQWLHGRASMLRHTHIAACIVTANRRYNNNRNPTIQGVTGGTDQTSGGCSLGQTIPI